jgi:hypothetical protein
MPSSTRSTRISPTATSTTSIASPRSSHVRICPTRKIVSQCGAQTITSAWAETPKS